ncbi:putative palmitoyltransferase ZDHHC24 [Amphibalanus amphitrite]|uniref:Palmitoyltransferase n=1 Tax=Amphibalanus amphitrite TaxID=1232801 RepID=A0A6A4W5H0_AMPAM|nr:putative palmitoyltransferase ZDHHC24 [Amphibalanus amphitrite]
MHFPLSGQPVCGTCQTGQPPRSHHCSKCRQCVDKRDHHCLFTGCCVGRQNHRYFICGILAVFVGSLYGIIYEWDMVLEAAGGYSLWLPLQLSAPHLLWPFGLLDGWGLLVCVHNMLGLSVLVNAGLLVYLQLSALRRGQTQFERKRGITLYDRGLRQNLRNVLGERWLVALFWPFADSPLPAVEETTEDGGVGAGKADIGDDECSEASGERLVGDDRDDQMLTKRLTRRPSTD